MTSDCTSKPGHSVPTESPSLTVGEWIVKLLELGKVWESEYALLMVSAHQLTLSQRSTLVCLCERPARTACTGCWPVSICAYVG